MNVSPEMLALLKGREVLCGFSGGADSSALLLLLNDAASQGQFALKAVHFEHGIRGAESQADADFCEKFCWDRSIPFVKIELSVPQNAVSGEGLEAAARRLRLECWRQLAADSSAIALGHNADDRAENLLLRLFRGSNATGLSSMRAAQRLGKALFVRPLLLFRRSEIEAFLLARGESSWRKDSTNDDEAYKRNFLRHSLLPSIAKALPYAIDGMAHSLKALQDDASCLEELALKEWDALKEASIPAQWLWLPPAIRVRVLRLWLSDRLGFDFIPDSSLIKRFDAALASAGTESVLIPLKESDAFIAMSSKGVALLKSGVQPDLEWSWREAPKAVWGAFALEAETLATAELPEDNWSAVFDASALPDVLHVGRWHEGERMTPLGRKSPEKLKELFNKAGVGSVAREMHPVLRAQPNGEPLWIPGVKRGGQAVLKADSKAVVRLRCRAQTLLQD